MIVEIVDYPTSASKSNLLLATTTGQGVIAAVFVLSDAPAKHATSCEMALQQLSTGYAAESVERDGVAYVLTDVAEHAPGSLRGFDELVDYSVFDFFVDSVTWEPRLSATRGNKIIYSARHRALVRRQLLASLYVRFADETLDETVLHLVNHGNGLVTNLTPDIRFDGTSVPVGPGGGAKWLEYMWHAEVWVVEQTPSAITFGVQLRNNKDNSLCERQTKLQIEADAGYAPKRYVTTDAQGKATFTVLPLGLTAGDSLKVKLNTTHFTNIGSAGVTL
jgi:hypothetical protein